jgi:hypothetical protein
VQPEELYIVGPEKSLAIGERSRLIAPTAGTDFWQSPPDFRLRAARLLPGKTASHRACTARSKLAHLEENVTAAALRTVSQENCKLGAGGLEKPA